MKLDGYFPNIIQFELVQLIKPSSLTDLYKKKIPLVVNQKERLCNFAYSYDFEKMEVLFEKYGIYGGIVWDPKIVFDIESYFTLFLYYEIEPGIFRRINTLDFLCECGFEGVSFAAYDQYETIRMEHRKIVDYIGQTIANETTVFCDNCGAKITPTLYSYKQISRSEYLSCF